MSTSCRMVSSLSTNITCTPRRELMAESRGLECSTHTVPRLEGAEQQERPTVRESLSGPDIEVKVTGRSHPPADLSTL